MFLLAVVASLALLWNDASRREGVDAAPSPQEAGLVLVGFIEGDVALERCEARCTSMRLESPTEVHRSAIDEHGRFAFDGLEDVDYCVEVVLRSNPTLVVARAEYVRPGGGEVFLTYDPLKLFGPGQEEDGESR